MHGSAGETERLQIFSAGTLRRRRFRHVDQRLGRLSVRDGGDDAVGRGIDGGHRIAVLDTDIDTRPVA
jgi:hypothetical protein